MIQIRNILCPLDLSDTSAAAFGYATMLSRWYDASLTAVEMIWVGLSTVRPAASPLVVPDAQMTQFSAELEQFVEAHTPPGMRRPTIVLREGPIVAGILDEARTRSTDLIVLGTHGRGGFDRFILGSVAEKILRKAPCPVLTVPPGSPTAPAAPQPFKAILCAIDFSPASLKALQYAVSLALESGKRLILVHVFDWPVNRPMPGGLGPETSAERRRSEEAALRELGAALPAEVSQWCDCVQVTAVGRPYEEILKVAAAKGADLIVLGVHGRSGVELALFGSTTNHVVRQATCPVLTIRP